MITLRNFKEQGVEIYDFIARKYDAEKVINIDTYCANIYECPEELLDVEIKFIYPEIQNDEHIVIYELNFYE